VIPTWKRKITPSRDERKESRLLSANEQNIYELFIAGNYVFSLILFYKLFLTK